MNKTKRVIWFLIILISGIYAFVTFMVYQQSDDERENGNKIKATIIDAGEVEKEVISRGKSFVEKYYQDIWIEFRNNGILEQQYCQRVMADTKRGYKVGETVTCYVDDENNVTFAYNVRDNLRGTIVAAVIFAVGVWQYRKAGREKKQEG